MALPWWRSPVDQPTSIQTSDKYTDILQVYRNTKNYYMKNLNIIQFAGPLADGVLDPQHVPCFDVLID